MPSRFSLRCKGSCPPDASAAPISKKRMSQAKEKLAALRAEYEDKLNRGRERTRAGDPREAFRLFARAQDIAEDNDFPWTLTEEQLYGQARIDLPARRGAARGDRSRARATTQTPPRYGRSHGAGFRAAKDTFVSQEQERSRG